MTEPRNPAPEEATPDESVEPVESVELVETVIVIELDAEVEPAADGAESEESAVAPEPAESEVIEVEVTDSEVTEVDAAVPEVADIQPAPAPVPVPSPRPSPARAAAAASTTSIPTTPQSSEPWGRVDEDGTVFVREGDGWREVGQFPDGSHEEALAYYERKYHDLADRVTLLEQRQKRAGTSAADLRAAAKHLAADIDGAAAVGDLAGLTARLTALVGVLGAASEAEAAANREAVDEAIRARTELVEKAEALAAQDPKSIQWKQTTTELAALFDQWQSQQQAGPRLPKSASQQLWSRFRAARSSLEKHRREFYAELDEQHRGVRDRKAKLVEKAEALAPKGEDGIAAYRELLDQWKTAGRAGKKVDDALWARFKAAGDALYQARAQRDADEAAASVDKIEQRTALLEEAKAVSDEKDIAKARALLTGIQRRWDAVGRIFPRDKERALDDGLRRIEQALRDREETDWKRNNPETRARANDMTRQLNEAIEKLEAEVAAAKKAGDKKAIAAAEEALKARRAWLTALGG